MDPRTDSTFRGVVPKDGLPTTIDALPVAFVCNTDDGDEPGEHWIALYLDADGHGDYSCSYGLLPRHAAFRTSCTNIVPSGLVMSRDFRVICRSLAYLLRRCNGFLVRTFANIFGTGLVANDCRVFDWLK